MEERLLVKKAESIGTWNLSPQVGLTPPRSSTLVLYTWQCLPPLDCLYGEVGGTVVRVMKGLRRCEKGMEEEALRPSADMTVISIEGW